MKGKECSGRKMQLNPSFYVLFRTDDSFVPPPPVASGPRPKSPSRPEMSRYSRPARRYTFITAPPYSGSRVKRLSYSTLLIIHSQPRR